jgi:hypothetical protein
MVAIPSAATVPAAVVKVVANRAAAVGQGAGRIGPHRSAAEGITTHALTSDSLEVGPRDFARATCKAPGTKISGRTTVERTAAVEPTASIERATAVDAATVDAATIDAAITAEVAGAAAKITAVAEITSAEVATAEVTTTATEVAATTTEVTATAAEPAAAHGPPAAATKASTAVAATTAMRPGDRRGRHLARDHGRHDHDSEPTSGLRQPMHRVFSETGCGHKLSINRSSLHSAHLLECQRRGVGQVHAVDSPLDHVRRRLPLA